jgi:succinoglycan biosynthesis transport protein ExoP
MASEKVAARDVELGPSARTNWDWIAEAQPSQGLRLYLDVLRARLKLVALLIVVVVGSAALFVAQAEKVYEAEADLLVTPIPDDNENLFGLGLVSQSGDPTRDAETLAQLITTPAVAERVRVRLGVARTARSLLADVSAEPVAQSSIVTVTALANDPEFAARLANAFGDAATSLRTERMRDLLNSVIPQLRDQLEELPAGEVRSRETLTSRLRALETLRLLPDPTLHFETRAAPPASPVAPRPVLTVAGAFIASLILAFGVVFGRHVLDPRIEREDDLHAYRIPVIGRIPRERRRLRHRGPLWPDEASPTTVDGLQRLAGSLAAHFPAGSRTVFITSPGPADGKTSTAINLAAALTALRERVILIDGDSRGSSLSALLGDSPEHGLTDVVKDTVALDEALVEWAPLPGARIVPREPGGESAPTLISVGEAERLIRDAKARANWVIVDGPALNYAPDALPLAKAVASVVVVVHVRRTRARDLADLAELLMQQRITPDGFIVVGGKARRVYTSNSRRRGSEIKKSRGGSTADGS